MISVVTVFAPRPQHPQWRDYVELLQLQRWTCEKFRHRHIVVTDEPAALPAGFETLQVTLPQSLMHAILTGQIAYLEQWSGEHPAVLVDADCLIARDLAPAFDDPLLEAFDVGITPRDNPESPVNNGAMYVQAGAKAAALGFFRYALEVCGDHWGGDQEAIAHAARPVMLAGNVARRRGARIAFLSMLTHNCIPMGEGQPHRKNPYVVHFKGNRKPWAATYARLFLLGDMAQRQKQARGAAVA